MDHAIRLANIHDIGYSNDFSRSKAVLGITRETFVELQKHLRVGRSPRIDLANVGVAAGCSTNVICAMDEAWHTLVETCPKSSMQMVDGVCQVRAVSERGLCDVALAISRGVRRGESLHRLAAFQGAQKSRAKDVLASPGGKRSETRESASFGSHHSV